MNIISDCVLNTHTVYNFIYYLLFKDTKIWNLIYGSPQVKKKGLSGFVRDFFKKIEEKETDSNFNLIKINVL